MKYSTYRSVVLVASDGERILLGYGFRERGGVRLRNGKYIDKETFQRNYPGSIISIEKREPDDGGPGQGND